MLRMRETIQSHFKWLALFFLTLCFFVSTISVSATTVTYLCALGCVLLSDDWHSRWQRIKTNPSALSFWLLFALFIIGIFYSTSTTHLIWRDINKHHWLLATPFLMIAIQEERWRMRMINAFLIAMIITVALAYAKYFFHFSIVTRHSNFPHLPDDMVFNSHIVQSFSMNIAAFICVYRMLFEKKMRWLYVIFYILMAIDILFLSKGRTGYLIFLLVLLYLGAIRFKLKGVLSACFLGFALIITAYFSSAGFQMRVNALYDHSKNYANIERTTSVGQRIEMYHIAKTMIAKRPWFGYGTGGMQTELPKIVPAKDRRMNPNIGHVESIYLNFLISFGVVGLCVLLIALWMQIKFTFTLPHQYRCLMQVVLISVFIGGVMNKFFLSFPITHLYSLFAAVCFGA